MYRCMCVSLGFMCVSLGFPLYKWDLCLVFVVYFLMSFIVLQSPHGGESITLLKCGLVVM